MSAAYVLCLEHMQRMDAQLGDDEDPWHAEHFLYLWEEDQGYEPSAREIAEGAPVPIPEGEDLATVTNMAAFIAQANAALGGDGDG